MRTIAIDWSGAVSGAHKRIWLAEVIDGELVRLENGRNSVAIAEYLCKGVSPDERAVVGFDFAFGFPAWYARELGASSAHGVWDRAVREGDAWLKKCEPPFWGRPNTTRPVFAAESMHFRRTEQEIETIKGIRPKSVLQIGGAGAVGTASIRGMSVLRTLSSHGFGIWPFADAWPRVIEIYPRVLTGAVRKSNPDDRAAFLDLYYPDLPADLSTKAASSEDAFDAAVSALVMSAHIDELDALEMSRDEEVLLEGWIWCPKRDPLLSRQVVSAGHGVRPERAALIPDSLQELARELFSLAGPDEFQRLMSELVRRYRNER